jgi:hypothetical protein
MTDLLTVRNPRSDVTLSGLTHGSLSGCNEVFSFLESLLRGFINILFIEAIELPPPLLHTNYCIHGGKSLDSFMKFKFTNTFDFDIELYNDSHSPITDIDITNDKKIFVNTIAGNMNRCCFSARKKFLISVLLSMRLISEIDAEAYQNPSYVLFKGGVRHMGTEDYHGIFIQLRLINSIIAGSPGYNNDTSAPHDVSKTILWYPISDVSYDVYPLIPVQRRHVFNNYLINEIAFINLIAMSNKYFTTRRYAKYSHCLDRLHLMDNPNNYLYQYITNYVRTKTEHTTNVTNINNEIESRIINHTITNDNITSPVVRTLTNNSSNVRQALSYHNVKLDTDFTTYLASHQPPINVILTNNSRHAGNKFDNLFTNNATGNLNVNEFYNVMNRVDGNRVLYQYTNGSYTFVNNFLLSGHFNIPEIRNCGKNRVKFNQEAMVAPIGFNINQSLFLTTLPDGTTIKMASDNALVKYVFLMDYLFTGVINDHDYQQLITDTLRDEFVVYRLHDYLLFDNNVGLYYDIYNLKRGSIIFSPTYWSTSYSQTYGYDYFLNKYTILFVIKIKKNCKKFVIFDKYSFNPSEHEIVLNKNSYYKVTKTSYSLIFDRSGYRNIFTVFCNLINDPTDVTEDGDDEDGDDDNGDDESTHTNPTHVDEHILIDSIRTDSTRTAPTHTDSTRTAPTHTDSTRTAPTHVDEHIRTDSTRTDSTRTDSTHDERERGGYPPNNVLGGSRNKQENLQIVTIPEEIDYNRKKEFTSNANNSSKSKNINIRKIDETKELEKELEISEIELNKAKSETKKINIRKLDEIEELEKESKITEVELRKAKSKIDNIMKRKICVYGLTRRYIENEKDEIKDKITELNIPFGFYIDLTLLESFEDKIEKDDDMFEIVHKTSNLLNIFSDINKISGGDMYYNKYIKYKTKYLKLKKIMNNKK